MTKKWTKTAVTLLIGAVLGIAAQNLGERWSRPAQAASIDDLARSAMGSLLQAMPGPQGQRIRGVAGLGDGETFIVHTDNQILFYRFVNPYRSSSSR